MASIFRYGLQFYEEKTFFLFHTTESLKQVYQFTKQWNPEIMQKIPSSIFHCSNIYLVFESIQTDFDYTRLFELVNKYTNIKLLFLSGIGSIEYWFGLIFQKSIENIPKPDFIHADSELNLWLPFIKQYFPIQNTQTSIFWDCEYTSFQTIPFQLQIILSEYNHWKYDFHARDSAIQILRTTSLTYIPIRHFWNSNTFITTEWNDFIMDWIELIEDTFPNTKWEWSSVKNELAITPFRQWRNCYWESKKCDITLKYSIHPYAKWKWTPLYRQFWKQIMTQPFISFKYIPWNQNETPDLLFTQNQQDVIPEKWNMVKVVLLPSEQEPVFQYEQTKIPILTEINSWFLQPPVANHTIIFGCPWKKRYQLKQPAPNQIFYWICITHPTYLVSESNCVQDGPHIRIQTWADAEWALRRSSTFCVYSSNLSSSEQIFYTMAKLAQRIIYIHPSCSVLPEPNFQYSIHQWHLSIQLLSIAYHIKHSWNTITNHPITPNSSTWIPIQTIQWDDFYQANVSNWIQPQQWTELYTLLGNGRRIHEIAFLWYIGIGAFQGAYPQRICSDSSILVVIPKFTNYYDTIAQQIQIFAQNYLSQSIIVLFSQQYESWNFTNQTIFRFDWWNSNDLHSEKSFYAICDSSSDITKLQNQNINILAHNRIQFTTFTIDPLYSSLHTQLIYEPIAFPKIQSNTQELSDFIRVGWLHKPDREFELLSILPNCTFHYITSFTEKQDFYRHIDIICIQENEMELFYALQMGKPFLSSSIHIVPDIEEFCKERMIPFPGWILSNQQLDTILYSLQTLTFKEIQMKSIAAKICFQSHWNPSFSILTWFQQWKLPPMEISILIPYYKVRESYLRECLLSIESQIGIGSQYKLEVLLINDGNSKDWVHASLIEEFQTKWNALSFGSVILNTFQIVHNFGISSALRLGVRMAKYNCILRMDADDIMTKYRVWKQGLLLYQDRKENRHIIRGGQIHPIHEKGYCQMSLFSQLPNQITWDIAEQHNFYALHHQTIGFWRDDMVSIGSYPIFKDINIRGREDIIVWANAMFHHIELINEPEIYVWAREHPMQTTISSSFQKKTREIIQMIRSKKFSDLQNEI